MDGGEGERGRNGGKEGGREGGMDGRERGREGGREGTKEENEGNEMKSTFCWILSVLSRS